MEYVMLALGNVFEPTTLLTMIIGLTLGMIFGALPGLTATMGVAILLPITFGMDPLQGLLVLIGIYFGAIYGGAIPAILINTPGTPAAAATTIDGYQMSLQGNAGRAMSISIVATVAGGTFATIVLILVAPQLAQVALQFNSPEYFAMAIFGTSIIVSLSSNNMFKGVFVGLLGMLLATVGIDSITGVARFTFGNVNLLGGVSFIPVLIGIFAFSQALIMIEEVFTGTTKVGQIKVEGIFPKLADIARCKWTILRSSAIGTMVGAIPGTGGDISAFISYNETKRWSKNRDNLGKGEIEGVAAPEAANNATCGGCFIPLLTLGIPGDAPTAIMLGALIMQGVRPGPSLFNEQQELLYSIFAGMLVSQVVLFIVALLGLRIFIKVLSIKKEFLIPLIIILCVIGALAINNNMFDVYVMIAFGVLWYFAQKFGFPQSPLIIGLILGPMAESEFRRSLVISNGDFAIFYTSPIVVALLTVAFLSIIAPALKPFWARYKNKKATGV